MYEMCRMRFGTLVAVTKLCWCPYQPSTVSARLCRRHVSSSCTAAQLIATGHAHCCLQAQTSTSGPLPSLRSTSLPKPRLALFPSPFLAHHRQHPTGQSACPAAFHKKIFPRTSTSPLRLAAPRAAVSLPCCKSAHINLCLFCIYFF